MFIKQSQCVGIIGLRSGSKSVRHKNIRDFLGRPLAARIIESALEAKNIDRVIVSTDSEVYAEIALRYGAEVPCLRPSQLSEDDSPEFDYIDHMINFLEKTESYFPKYIVRLQATVPFQISDDIDAVVNILKNNDHYDSAMVIAKARQNPARALKIINDIEVGSRLVDYITGESSRAGPVNRQELTSAYFRANIIACRRDVMFGGTMIGNKIGYHIIPQERAVDIDSELDFVIAETIANLVINSR